MHDEQLEILDFLRRHAPFDGLAEERLQQVARSVDVRYVKAGTRIVEFGQPAIGHGARSIVGNPGARHGRSGGKGGLESRFAGGRRLQRAAGRNEHDCGNHRQRHRARAAPSNRHVGLTAVLFLRVAHQPENGYSQLNQV